MTDTRDHPPGCICRACEDLFDEMDGVPVEVCQNCGAYFTPLPGQLSQRCRAARCRVPNDPPVLP